MKEPRGQELINRYKKNFHIPKEVVISEEMILKHWELEKNLTRQLWESTQNNRWETFDMCYTKLYSDLDWLNKFVDSANVVISPEMKYSMWPIILGAPPKNIYEIGSGKGELISYLASMGYKCVGTEVTRERGNKHVSEYSNLSWEITDGIHLARFVESCKYDVVISNQVIEHLHPDDLVDHFKGVQSILVEGGKYIFTTPHKSVGPSDVSLVFKCEKPMGMHLKEYDYGEIKKSLEDAGFINICAVIRIPERISRVLGNIFKPKPSRIFLSYLCLVETLISLFPKQAIRRKVSLMARFILFMPSIFVVAQKEKKD